MEALIVIIVILFFVFIVAIASVKKSNKNKNNTNIKPEVITKPKTIEKKPDDENRDGTTGLTIHMKVPESIDKINNNKEEKLSIETHTFLSIMLYDKGENGWVCPNCESENSFTENTCCVCNNQR